MPGRPSSRPQRVLGIAFAGTALLAAAAASAQDVMQVGADTHSVVLENARVRVLAARVEPGGKVPMHSHPANVVYFLGDAKVRVITPDGKSVIRDIKGGTASWYEPVTHAVENVGTTEFREVQIELKDAAPGQ
jgi:quercetin dioxygenase-like cupin family protein